MADDRATPSGWLPPVAPDTRPRPTAPDARPQAAAPGTRPHDNARPAGMRPPRPTFERGSRAASGERNAHAVWALVLAITGLALLLVSLGALFVVALPCSMTAWWLAGQARRRLEAGETAHGSGQAVAALWIARIGVIAGVAAAVVLIALIASGFDFEQFRDDLERELDEQRESPGDAVRTGLDGLRAATGR